MVIVLVVDDDPALLRLVSVILRIDDISVETSSSPQEGLLTVQEHDPDLILLDLNMPEMDGRDFYRECRSIGYTGPIVICSAYDGVVAQRELGADAVLNKPFDPDSLLELVHELLPA